MKKLVVFLFVAMMSVTSFANEGTPTSKEVKKEIRTKIVNLLGKAHFNVEEEIKTTVDFLINKNGELVILNVECVNPTVCAFVKSKLNYKRVTNKSNKTSKVYKMPLRIVK